MDLPMSWLSDYVDLDCTTKEFMDAITLSGSKVEGVTHLAADIDKVVNGKVLKIVKHPDADKLVITTINIGAGEPLQIVTGASNLYEGAYVPVALSGSTLPGGLKIKEGKLRGVESYGMLCSVEELGCDRHDFPEAPEHGIYIYPEPVELGKSAVDTMELKDDVVEFEITSNRPDCFSITGLAREAAATYNKPLKMPEISVKEEAEGDITKMISVEIKNPDLCPRYAARVIKDVKIEPSPRWMRKRLRAAGVRPINNIVDITNFVMLELGQPMHAFNINTIADRRIIVRNAKDGETITTLDGIERKLDPSMLVISDPEKAVAVAGVMGGENSMISENADGVLFESANFNGPNIRITAKKLGLRTDASSKYEKGLDPNLSGMAVDRAAQLVELLGAGKVVKGIVDCYPNVRTTWDLSYDPAWINGLLGTDISEDTMIDIFERLGIVVDKAAKKVTIPTYRPDLEAQADLAEEVARLYGYDKIAPTLAAGTPTVGKRTYKQRIVAMVKNSMLSCGLSEAMNYSFESPKVFDKLRIPEDSILRKAVTISNPLGEDFSVMRTTTLNGMLTSLATNYNRRNESAGLFEVAKVYLPHELPLTELPDEPEVLTIGAYGNNMDFYDIKGYVEYLLDRLGMADKAEFIPDKETPWMHPGRCAYVHVGDENIGYLGEVHPSVADNYSIKTKVYVAVLYIKALADYASLVTEYKPLPKYPSVTRDISMLVKDDVFVNQIEKVIKSKAGKHLEKVTLFDVYKGNQIPEGMKSVSYSITFRADDKTLVDDDVTSAMKNILDALENELNAVLRDK